MSRFPHSQLIPQRVRSIALQVTALTVATYSVLLTISLVVLYALLVRFHERDDVNDLNERIEILRATLRSHGDDPVFLRQEIQLEAEAGSTTLGGGPGSFIFFGRILDESGGLIIETGGMGRLVPASAFPAPIPEGRHVLGPNDFFHWSADGREFDAASALAREGGS